MTHYPNSFSTQTWIPHRYALIAMLGAASILAALALPVHFGAPLVLLGGLVYVQFLRAAIFMPLPSRSPFLVRWSDRLMLWWDFQSRPAFVSEYCGRPVLERFDGWGYSEMYNSDGSPYGYVQTINWSDTDPDWYPGVPENRQEIFTPAAEAQNPRRLPLIARLRSPRLVKSE